MKLLKIFAALCLFISLGACGKSSESSESSAPQPSGPAEAAVNAAAGPKVVESSFGRGEGVIGDTMKTSFLEFTLNKAALTSNYQGVTPDAGMALLVLNITTKSTQSTPLTLYDTDYQVQWGGSGEEDYSTPLTYRDEWATAPTYKRSVNLDGVTGMFPGTVQLAKDETNTADFVYQVPENTSDFKLEFKEFFQDESLGDFFCVTFHADAETPQS